MKFTLIGPVYPYRGGIAHYTTQLAISCRENGHDCKVISFKRQYPSWLYPGGSDLDPSTYAVRIDADYLLDPIYPWTWIQTTKEIKEQDSDLVILQWWTTYWSLPFAVLTRQLKNSGLPVVYLVHNVLPHEEKPFDRWLTRWTLSPANGYILQTEHEQQRLLKLLPNAICEISPHPVYSMLTSLKIEKSQARQELGLPMDNPVFLFFGIVRPYKGLKYLIEAMAIIKAHGVTPYLLVAGDFWQDRKQYEQQIESLGLLENIRLDDRYIPDEEAALMFSAADLLVAPYVAGTQSGVAGIGLGFGLPLIVTDLVAAGLSETERDMVWVVPSANANALADAMRMFLEEQPTEQTKSLQVEDNWWKLVGTLESFAERMR